MDFRGRRRQYQVTRNEPGRTKRRERLCVEPLYAACRSADEALQLLPHPVRVDLNGISGCPECVARNEAGRFFAHAAGASHLGPKASRTVCASLNATTTWSGKMRRSGGTV